MTGLRWPRRTAKDLTTRWPAAGRSAGDGTGRAEQARDPRPNALAALHHRQFRVVFLGAFLPHVGTWMRQVVLTAFAYDITGSAAFVGQLIFVYLAPVILLGIPAGLLLDRRNRRNLLIVGFALQGALSVVLAVVAST